MEARNVKAIREALNEIRARLAYLYGRTDGTFDPPALKEVYEIAGTALAKPPRNCDVGTEKEQTERFVKFCYPQKCNECKLHTDELFYECVLSWSQMQYKEVGSK